MLDPLERDLGPVILVTHKQVFVRNINTYYILVGIVRLRTEAMEFFNIYIYIYIETPM
jgi:hypothetical protein